MQIWWLMMFEQNKLNKVFKLTVLASCLSFCYSSVSFASIVRDDVDYQYFRDFAENKGQFFVGAKNVPIYDKKGNNLGLMLRNLPMIDFSAITRTFGIATLIEPQYITSVQHNNTYSWAVFGSEGYIPDEHHYYYFLTNRNDYPNPPTKAFPLKNEDFHAPRLHKLVTETAPLSVTNAGVDPAVYKSDRFAAFVRVGSGRQEIESRDGNTRKRLSEGYEYLTGGAPLDIVGNERYRIDLQGSLYSGKYGPLITYGAPGDSGSALFGYDKVEKRWVVVGVLELWWYEKNKKNRYTAMHKDFIDHVKKKDIAGTVNNTVQNAVFNWIPNGNVSDIKSGSTTVKVDLADEKIVKQDSLLQRPSLDHGKNVTFKGKKGTLVLTKNINQGAGALYFDTDFVVTPQHNQTYLGAGVSVAKGKTVEWKVGNPKGDRLSKIGEGTLLVNGNGVNYGDISVGDGTVILNQQRGGLGTKKAFNQVGIVSGRPTVVLKSADQINLDKLYFGYRGGRLDVDGLALNFNYIQNADDGARIVNHNQNKIANLVIRGYSAFKANEINWKQHGTGFKTDTTAIYERRDNNGQVTGYFALLGDDPRANLPTHQNSSKDWKFVGTTKDQAIKYATERNNKLRLNTTFSGYFGETDRTHHNGAMNITYAPTLANTKFLVSGGINLQGTFKVNGGEVFLSGRPTPHARDMLKKQEVVFENDWINRTFNAKVFNVVNNAKLYIGRNVPQVNGNFVASNNAQLHLGFKQNDPICQRSDYYGVTSCANKTLAQANFNALPKTEIKGHIKLHNNAQLHLGLANLSGRIHADKTTAMYMAPKSYWNMNGDSVVGNLNMGYDNQYASAIRLGKSGQPFNQLTVSGNLSGKGIFEFNFDPERLVGDQVVVQGRASGEYTFNVFRTNQTVFPLSSRHLASLTLRDRLTLFKVLDTTSRPVFNAGSIDFKAYRFQFVQDNKPEHIAVRLTNPYLEWEIAEAERIEAERNLARWYGNYRVRPFSAGVFRKSADVDDEKVPNPEDVLQAAAARAENAKAAMMSAVQRDYTSRATNAALSLLSSQANVALQVGDSLSRRYLVNAEQSFAVWTNYEWKKTENGSKNYRTYEQTNRLTQLGVESAVNSDKDFRIGGVLSSVNSQSQFDNEVANKNKWLQFSAYAKKSFDTGLFAVADVSLAQGKNKLTYAQTNAQVKQKMSAVGVSLGYQQSLVGLDISPMLSARYQHFSMKDFALEDLAIQTSSFNFISYRAGLQVAKALNWNDWTFMPMLAAYYVDASQKKVAVMVDNTAFNQQFGRYFTQELGLAAQLKQWQLKTNLSKSYGSESSKQRAVNVTLSYSW